METNVTFTHRHHQSTGSCRAGDFLDEPQLVVVADRTTSSITARAKEANKTSQSPPLFSAGWSDFCYFHLWWPLGLQDASGSNGYSSKGSATHQE